jgi:histone chaperone ASF1
MLLSCSYLDKEFIRVGYYVNNDYISEELRENPPALPDLQKIQRSILADKPRVEFYLNRLQDLLFLGTM